LTKAVCNFSL